MFTRRITLHNWGPYRGEHTLELGPHVYGVTAQHDDDSRRSNWLGKSWFLAAFKFALYGVRPKSAATEDDWISWGEEDGGVLLELTDGTCIERTRTIGSSTQLRVGKATQKKAQAVLDRLTGMDKDDFDSGAFVGQKQISKLVTALPSERTKLVTGWLALGPLKAAQAHAADRLRERGQEARRLRDRVLVLTEAAAAWEGLEERLADLQKRERKLTKKYNAAVKVAKTLEEHRRHAERVIEYERLVEDGQALRAKLDGAESQGRTPKALRAAAIDAHDRKQGTTKRARDLERLVQGQFDGKCPVTCEECPVAETVMARGREMSEEWEQARKMATEAASLYEKRERLASRAEQEVRQRERDQGRLDTMREQAEALLDSRDYIREHGDPAEPVDTQVMAVELARLTSMINLLERDEADRDKHVRESGDIADTLEAVNDDVQTWREAVQVIRGAHREISEGALTAMENGANALMTDAGIDLTLEVQWEHEGGGLASNCDQCGSPYPSSRSIKTCGTCEAERGKKIIEELHLVPSDVSGAAEDITGLAFQLSAAAWLRVRRGSEWESVFIDEPFGSLDPANREALSMHLHQLLRSRYAFKQAFLVSHDPGVMAAMPHRIVIRSDGESSRLEAA